MQYLASVHHPVVSDLWLDGFKTLAANEFKDVINLATGPTPRMNLASPYDIRQMPGIDEADRAYLLGAFVTAQANQTLDPQLFETTNFYISRRNLLLGLEPNPVLAANHEAVVQALQQVGKIAIATTPYSFGVVLGRMRETSWHTYQNVLGELNNQIRPDNIALGRITLGLRNQHNGPVELYES